jgi:hypothetical protein
MNYWIISGLILFGVGTTIYIINHIIHGITGRKQCPKRYDLSGHEIKDYTKHKRVRKGKKKGREIK